MTDNRYIIIGRSNCPFCCMAADLCKAKKIQHVLLDYVKDEDVLEDYKTFHQQNTVPIILENCLETGHTKKIGGYSDLVALLSSK
tara:strand:+ start:255 stop:509 length:255 start_codon:yes stop_codon:yes gene_type:complete